MSLKKKLMIGGGVLAGLVLGAIALGSKKQNKSYEVVGAFGEDEDEETYYYEDDSDEEQAPDEDNNSDGDEKVTEF